jgi:hypothetical protein
MPTAIVEPRDIALELWLQGFTVPQIGQQLSLKPVTIYSWKRRLGWKRPGPKPPGDAQIASLQGVAERLSNLTVTQAERILCTIRDCKLDGLKECRDASSALSASYAVARKALGLDDGPASVSVHFHGGGRLPVRESAPVIDVSPSADTTSTPANADAPVGRVAPST